MAECTKLPKQEQQTSDRPYHHPYFLSFPHCHNYHSATCIILSRGCIHSLYILCRIETEQVTATAIMLNIGQKNRRTLDRELQVFYTVEAIENQVISVKTRNIVICNVF